MAKTSYTGGAAAGTEEMSVFLVWAVFPELLTRVDEAGVTEKTVAEFTERIPQSAGDVCTMADQYETKNSAATIGFAIIRAPFYSIIRMKEKV
jgi:hypothetical protein